MSFASKFNQQVTEKTIKSFDETDNPLGFYLGAILEHLGVPWDPLGGSWGLLGGSLGPLGDFLGSLGGS